MLLHYILHKEIDFSKWDKALALCSNKLIYAESFYLNALCEKWNAIVSDDFEFIMPIPVKKKMGIQYVPVTPFIQQLGIFSKNELTTAIIQQFFKMLSSKIKLINYHLNYRNQTNLPNVQQCANFILPLNKPYNEIKKDFKKDFSKYLKPTSLTILCEHDFKTAIELFKKEYQLRPLKISNKQYNQFTTLCEMLHHKNRLIVAKAIFQNKIVATAIFFFDSNRIYNICSTITKPGKKMAANHHLYNYIFEKYANTNYTMDFEGSDVEGIAHFYESMGGINQPYQYVNINQLPGIIKLIKK